MTREEASRILHPDTWLEEYKKCDTSRDMDDERWNLLNDEAHAMGAEALRGGWIKTADRPPTQDDADIVGNVLARTSNDTAAFFMSWQGVAKRPLACPWWMPIPRVPEVEK